MAHFVQIGNQTRDCGLKKEQNSGQRSSFIYVWCTGGHEILKLGYSSRPGQQTRVQRDEDVYLLCLQTWQLDSNTCIHEHFRVPVSPHAKKKKKLAQMSDSNFSTTVRRRVALNEEAAAWRIEPWAAQIGHDCSVIHHNHWINRNLVLEIPV